MLNIKISEDWYYEKHHRSKYFLFQKKSGMTQEELAEKMNVTSQAVSKWENDLSYPDIECVGRLAAILGTTVNCIIDGEDAAPHVELCETETPEKRILLLSVKVKPDNMNVNVRLPVEVILKACNENRLEKLLGKNSGHVESALEIIKSGVVGTIVDVEGEEQSVKIEVINYED